MNRSLLERITGKSNPRIFVTGIDTNIGKTVASAVLAKELEYDYWKPIQCGELDDLDSGVVKSIKSDRTVIHPESVLLDMPASPHLAAKSEGKVVYMEDFKVPSTDNGLIVEGAGGIMVPINEEGLMVFDLIKHLSDGVVLVTKNYLGSLNHTLLSISKLNELSIPVVAVLFNGEVHEESESIIKKTHPEIPVWLRMNHNEDFNQLKLSKS